MKKFFSQMLCALLSVVCVGIAGAQIGTVHLRLPDLAGKRGNTFAFPIYCDDSLTVADSVMSGELTVSHNGVVMDIVGINTIGTMLGSVQNTLYNLTTKKVVFANAQPVTGKGVLVYLTIQIKPSASGTSAVTLTGTMFNEGNPSVVVDPGSIRPMDIFINPKNPPVNKVVGDTLYFSATGDVTPPLSWSVSDTAIASINSTGRLIGKKVGQTKVIVFDSQGLSDQSNIFPINSPTLNSLTMSIRDTSFKQNLTFDLPIRISDVTSLGIISAQWKLNYNTNTLVAKAVITTGTMAQAWGVPTVNFGTGTIDVGMAGSDTITGQGILAYVRFQVKRFATQSSNLTLQNVLFNENINATIDDGFFTPTPGPTITINPNVQVLSIGDTLTYFATGGTPPYKWFSSNAAIASVDSLTGKVSAKSRGGIVLSAFDSQGFDGTFTLSVNNFLATLPDTSVRIGDSVDVPIYITDVTGLGIFSKQIKVGYDTTKVKFVTLLTTGTISDGMFTAVKDSAAVIRLAFAGVNPIAGSGVFAKLRFKHQPPSEQGQFSLLTFLEYQNNEAGSGQPTTTLKNGKISIVTALSAPSAPTLASPADGETGVSVTPTLSWNASSGAASYTVQVSAVSDFSTTVINQSGITQTSYNASGLSYNTQYFWKVSATNSGGTSAFSTSRNFTTVIAAPSSPTLASPADGETGVSVTPTLSWNASSGAASYTVQVSAVSDFSTTVINQSGITQTSYNVSGLSNNTQYFWKVSATNSGGTSAFSTSRNFTTVIAAPSSPTLASPADGVTGVSTSPALIWDAPSGAASYRVQVSTDPSFDIATLFVDQSGLVSTTFNLSGLLNSTIYYWHVSATNDGGEGAFSATRSFTTAPAAPPVPFLVSPLEMAEDVSITPTLVWHASPGATTYHLQLSKTSLFTTSVIDDSTLVDTTIQVGPLGNDTTYYWQVSAKNTGGRSPFAAVQSFKTIPRVPLAPALLLPADRDSTVSIAPTLQWSASAGVESYHLQVSTDTSFVHFVFNDSTLVDTTQQIGPLENDSTYYWRVRAKNAGGVSPFSAVRTFKTTLQTPLAPMLFAPLDGDSTIAITPALQWSASAGAKTYHLQVSTDTSFVQFVFNDSTLVDTTKQIGPLGNDTTYYWRVNAKNREGKSPFSDVWSFRTVPTPPLAPLLLSPSDGDSTVSITPTLLWAASARANTYHLQVCTDTSFVQLVFDDSTLVDTTQQIGPLENDTTYYWRMSAKNAGGVSPYSAVRRFRTEPLPAVIPLPPLLDTPKENAVNLPLGPNQSVTFTWFASQGATTYTLEVSTDSLFTSLFSAQSGIVTMSATVTGFQPGTTYFWRVSATNSEGTSSFSTSRSFTTVIAAPSSPTLASPADGETGVSVTPTLSWNASSGATSYTVQVSAVSDFSTTVINQSGITQTSYNASGLSYNTQYFWKVSATNSGGTSAFSTSWSFTTILSAPVNSNPAFTKVMGDTTINEDQQLTFDYDATDPDNDQVKFFLQSQPSGMTIDSITGVLNWKPNFNQSENYNFIVFVFDGEGGSASKQTNITVLNTNRSPVFTKVMGDTTINEDQQLTFDYDATDPDNDQGKFFLQNQPSGMTIDSITGVLNWKPNFNQSGNYNFIVFVFDGKGGSASRQTNITVLNVNRVPFFTQTVPETSNVFANQPFSFQFAASDPDNDTLNFSIVQAPSGATIVSKGLFTWTPTTQQAGTHRVIVKVLDVSLSVNDTSYFVVKLSNTSPVFTKAMGDTTITEDQQLTFDYDVFDAENDQVKFSLQNQPLGMAIDSIAGVLNWKPTFTQSGSYNFIVFAKDSNGGSASRQTNITVTNVNRAPFFTQTPPETTLAAPDQSINYLFTASDPDNDTLSFSVVEAPTGATITSSGNFTWTPTIAQVGTHRAIIKVADAGASENDTSYFVIKINNTPPKFTATLSDTTISEGQTLSFTYKATDNENDSLQFTLSPQPPTGLSLSTAGQLTWTPNFTQSGVYTIVVSVNDKQFSVLDTAKITVANVNRSPQFIVALPDVTVPVDTAVNFKYAAVDPDNDSLTFSFVKFPTGATIQSDGTFFWKPAAIHLGKDTIIVAVNDGSISVRDTAILTVIGFPSAQVSQTVFDFGSITFGGTKTLTTTVKNNGVVPLFFQALPQFNLVPNPNFVLDTVGASIVLPDQQKTVSIIYSPKTVGGHFTGYLFTTNDLKNPTFVLTANGSAIAKIAVSKKVLVDIHHNSTVALTDSVEGMGQLFTFLAKSEIQVSFTDLLFSNLQGSDVLLLVTPQENYSSSEVSAIRQFVNDGGLMIALGNSAQEGSNASLNSLLTDTAWTTNLLLNTDLVVDSSSNYFNAAAPLLTTFADAKHPYFANVDTLVFFASASIGVNGTAIPFITTTAKGNVFGVPNSTQPAVVGLSKVGKGKIIVLGDADAWRVDLKNDSIPPNLSIKDNLAFALNVFSITEDYPVKLPEKTLNERYQMVSIPFDLENSDIASVLKDLGDRNPLVWRLFGRYDPVAGKYAEFPSEKFKSFRRGEAYWLITRGEFGLSLGNTTVVPVQNFYPIKIGPGYSMIGNPFSYKVSWKNSIHDSVQNLIWRFDGTTFKAESLALQPFAGYFVKNLTKDSITIYINPQDITSLGKTSIAAASLGEGEWKIGISASSGKSSDEENFAGVAKGAQEEFDAYDVAEPPPTPTDYVIVRFPNNTWKQQPGSYAMDIRPINEEGLFWDFDVITAKTQSRIELSLSQLGNLPNDFAAYLVDKTSERVMRVDNTYHYEFTLAKNETRRNFRLIAGKTEYVEKNMQGIPLVAVDYALMQNFPNPFNPTTTISYTLAHSGIVNLEIFNILGQKIKTVVQSFQPIGFYSVQWDGADDANKPVASGIYYYRLQSNEFSSVKKMMLIK